MILRYTIQVNVPISILHNRLPVEGARLFEDIVGPSFPVLLAPTDDVDRCRLVDVFEYDGRTEDDVLLFLESMLEQESFRRTFVGLTHSALNL